MPTFTTSLTLMSPWGKQCSSGLLVLSCLAGCTSTSSVSEPPDTVLRDQHGALKQTRPLNDFYDKWQGVPYRWGGTTPTGVDCSALVQIAYANTWQIDLPRTTTQQSVIGQRVSPAQAVSLLRKRAMEI